ncbi:MAG TPA: chemotaxis protein CheA [Bryobacteraceae bacterium]|nr:chemotaxis protein CheA [Bryobacteraceae bacterium]
MSDSRQDQLTETSLVRELVDSLAAQLVMKDGDWADKQLQDLASTLGRMSAAAELSGRPDIHTAAVKLQLQVAEVRLGTSDRNGLELVMREGLTWIQEALERAYTAQPQAPQAPVAANALAQDAELVSDFILESREHLANIEVQLLALEQNPAEMEPIHSVFRGFHTIKGLAGFLEFSAMQAVAHEVETLLDRARNGELAVTAAVIDGALAAKDYLGREIQRVESELRGGPASPPQENAALVKSLRALLGVGAGGTSAPEPAAPGSGDLRALSQAVSSPQDAVPMGEAPAKPETRTEKKTSANVETRSVKVDTGKLDFLVDMVGEMVIAESMVRHNPELAGLSNSKLVRTLAQLGRITNEVQKTAMSMRMVPVGQLFQKMARLVRDLSRKHNKQVDLQTAGEETELDRNIVEELADPLMHMVRNAIDHGIETPDARRAAGKSPVARVTLRAFHQAGFISIEIADDGRGLNREKIVAKAREKGLIDSTDHLSDSEIFNLIFEPGFSTADKVTDISGRGVGMDVVRKKIQQLRGRVEIQSVAGQGTSFLLKLPLTLAIIEGLVVGVGKERYIVPVFAVKEMLRPTEEIMFTLENREEMALVRGRLFPVVRLYRRFLVKPRSEDYASSVLIIAESEGKDFCLMVDDVLGKQEVVIKSLGESLRNISGVAGGAILGDGRVGLILDMEGIYGRASHA